MCFGVMGSDRIFRRQKDIPVFIECEFFSSPMRYVVKGYDVLNGNVEQWI